MADKKWMLKGTFYESCRVNGHCPLWFGRDLTDGPCLSLATYHVEEGQIQDVDMTGIVFTYHGHGIGPKFTDLATNKKGIAKCAVYISDNATDQQKKILEPFLTTHLMSGLTQEVLGAKFVKIEITGKNGVYHIINPFCEQHLALTIGRDMQTPIRMENAFSPGLSNIRFCNTLSWKYKDYDIDLEYEKTSGAITDFKFSGTL